MEYTSSSTYSYFIFTVERRTVSNEISQSMNAIDKNNLVCASSRWLLSPVHSPPGIHLEMQTVFSPLSLALKAITVIENSCSKDTRYSPHFGNVLSEWHALQLKSAALYWEWEALTNYITLLSFGVTCVHLLFVLSKRHDMNSSFNQRLDPS